MKKFRLLPLVFFCAALCVATLFSACEKNKDTGIQGCMAPQATNYNAQANVATTCHYANEQLAGNYEIHDTVVTFLHNVSDPWNDTGYYHYILVVAAPNKDMLTFTPNLNTSLNFTNDCTQFSYYYDHNPPAYTTVGHFSGDTLYYRYSVRPIPSGSGTVIDRWFVAVKVK